MAEKHPKLRVRQFFCQGAEHLLPRVGPVVVFQLPECVGLRRVEEGPEVIFGDAVLRVRELGLFEHAIAMLADKVIRDVLLKGQLRDFLSLRHGLSRR